MLRDIFLRISRGRVLRYVVVGYTAAVFIAMAATYFGINEERQKSMESQTSRLHKEIVALRVRIDDAERKLQTKLPNEQDVVRISKALAAVEKLDRISDHKLSSLIADIATLEQTTSRLSDELRNVRSALNPTKPEELLTVVRLGDKVELFTDKLSVVEGKLDKFEETVNSRIQDKFETVNSQVDQLSGVIKWLGLLILPAVLSTLRDILVTRRKETTDDPEGT